MKLRLFSSFIVVMVLCASCSTNRHRVTVDVALNNATAVDLNGAALSWAGRQLTFGILVPNANAVLLDAGLPRPTGSDVATIEFIERTNKTPHKISIDAAPLRRLSPGRYIATFSILSFTEGRLQIDKREW